MGIPSWFAALMGAIVMASLCAFAFLFQNALRNGKVRSGDFGLPDLLASTVFFTWLIGLAIKNMTAPARVLTQQDLLSGGILYVLIIGAISGFLLIRKFNLKEQFGFRCVRWWKVPLFALGLLMVIFPVVGIAGAITQKILGPDAEPQEIVKFFQQAVQEGDSSSMLITILIGGILAPVAEELMFRGYLYPLCKRYAGVIAGVVFNSVFFAAMHANVTALPALCCLAVGFTLAYELTGSLLVPMVMHAVFNFTMFTVMLHSSAPQ